MKKLFLYVVIYIAGLYVISAMAGIVINNYPALPQRFQTLRIIVWISVSIIMAFFPMIIEDEREKIISSNSPSEEKMEITKDSYWKSKVNDNLFVKITDTNTKGCDLIYLDTKEITSPFSYGDGPITENFVPATEEEINKVKEVENKPLKKIS